MRLAFIVHGCSNREEFNDLERPSASNSHWIPWLQKQLTAKGILTQTPEMPEPYAPDFKKWKEVFEQFKINEDTSLIGHSCGGGFLIRWLSENKRTIGQLILVAPYLDPNEKRGDFLKFRIDSTAFSNISEIYVLLSDDEHNNVKISTDRILRSIPGTQLKMFTGKGHFVWHSMGTGEFPELEDIVLKFRNNY